MQTSAYLLWFKVCSGLVAGWPNWAVKGVKTPLRPNAKPPAKMAKKAAARKKPTPQIPKVLISSAIGVGGSAD